VETASFHIPEAITTNAWERKERHGRRKVYHTAISLTISSAGQCAGHPATGGVPFLYFFAGNSVNLPANQSSHQ